MTKFQEEARRLWEQLDRDVRKLLDQANGFNYGPVHPWDAANDYHKRVCKEHLGQDAMFIRNECPVMDAAIDAMAFYANNFEDKSVNKDPHVEQKILYILDHQPMTERESIFQLRELVAITRANYYAPYNHE